MMDEMMDNQPQNNFLAFDENHEVIEEIDIKDEEGPMGSLDGSAEGDEMR